MAVRNEPLFIIQYTTLINLIENRKKDYKDYKDSKDKKDEYKELLLKDK